MPLRRVQQAWEPGVAVHGGFRRLVRWNVVREHWCTRPDRATAHATARAGRVVARAARGGTRRARGGARPGCQRTAVDGTDGLHCGEPGGATYRPRRMVVGVCRCRRGVAAPLHVLATGASRRQLRAVSTRQRGGERGLATPPHLGHSPIHCGRTRCRRGPPTNCSAFRGRASVTARDAGYSRGKISAMCGFDLDVMFRNTATAFRAPALARVPA